MDADWCDLGELDSTGLGRQFGWIPEVLFQYQRTLFCLEFFIEFLLKHLSDQ